MLRFGLYALLINKGMLGNFLIWIVFLLAPNVFSGPLSGLVDCLAI